MADERTYSDIPYHNAETERIQAERQAELEKPAEAEVQQGPSQIAPAGTAYVNDSGEVIGVSDGENIVLTEEEHGEADE